jgi:hypothetical protein
MSELRASGDAGAAPKEAAELLDRLRRAPPNGVTVSNDVECHPAGCAVSVALPSTGNPGKAQSALLRSVKDEWAGPAFVSSVTQSGDSSRSCTLIIYRSTYTH